MAMVRVGDFVDTNTGKRAPITDGRGKFIQWWPAGQVIDKPRERLELRLFGRGEARRIKNLTDWCIEYAWRHALLGELGEANVRAKHKS